MVEKLYSCFYQKQPKVSWRARDLSKIAKASQQICSVTNLSDVSEDTTAHSKRQETSIVEISMTHIKNTTETHLVDELFMKNKVGKIIN